MSKMPKVEVEYDGRWWWVSYAPTWRNLWMPGRHIAGSPHSREDALERARVEVLRDLPRKEIVQL